MALAGIQGVIFRRMFILSIGHGRCCDVTSDVRRKRSPSDMGCCPSVGALYPDDSLRSSPYARSFAPCFPGTRIGCP